MSDTQSPAAESNESYPDELGLDGRAATYDPNDAPAEDVIIRGTESRRGDAWAVWVETSDGVIETRDEFVEVDDE